MPNPFLPFVEDDAIELCVRVVLDKATAARASKEKDVFKNVVDPFSAVFDASVQGISLASWLEQEKSRQAQKTMQNAVGEFHQQVIGSVKGWESLPVGGIIDIRSAGKKVIAEVKNKYNTTKGIDRVGYYDSFERLLVQEYKGFTAYYVEIIPKNKKMYNDPFTPSDNESSQRRIANEKIRIIDGKSFYHMVTGDINALEKLYKALPSVIQKVTGKPASVLKDSLFPILFQKAY